jgi:hypothetical protein
MDSPPVDHDFNNFWGTVLGVTELQERPIATHLAKQYWEYPGKAVMNYNETLSQYIDMFERVLTSSNMLQRSFPAILTSK